VAHICQVHPYEVAEGLCRSCGGPFCADCLVYPFGPVKPPYCVPCAVSAAGVRRNARNPTVVVPKETKRRLKEWRKARKRDMDTPPPDGVATWQKMDEAAVADEEDHAVAEAAAEREALRLPPPQPETPTPPPGVNLAPPGPPGRDWRDEIAVSQGPTGPPGFDGPPEPAVDLPPAIVGESALGAGWAGGDPGHLTDLAPRPAAEAPLPADDPYAAEAPLPADDPYAAEPRPTASGQPLVDGPLVEPASFDPFPAEPNGSDPLPAEAFEPAPYAVDIEEPEPAPYAPAREASDPGALPFTLELDGPDTGAEPLFAGTFEPTPFEPAVSNTPFVIEFDADPLGSFGLGGGTVADPLPPPPPAAEGHAFDPLPPPAPEPARDAVAPPPPSPKVPPHTRTTTTPGTPRLTPPPPPTRHVAPDVPRSAIRPRTPTRIPAADPAPAKTSDAKAMLARIAALRSERAD
jgi:hypothetical protein